MIPIASNITIQIPDGAELVCPQCGAPLTPAGKGPVNVLLPMLLIFALLVCGIGAGAWYLLKPKPSSVASVVAATTSSRLAHEPVAAGRNHAVVHAHGDADT